MRMLIVHPGPNFSVADVFNGWYEALAALGVIVAPYNMDERLKFYASAYVEAEKDEDGKPVAFRKAMTEEQACLAAMQGLSHAWLTFLPDVVMFISGFFVNAGTMYLLQSRGSKIVALHTESPYQEESQLARAVFADVNLINDPVNIEQYAELGAAEYMPHAYRPTVHYPRPAGQAPDPQLNADLAFVGTGFASRIEFFEAMNLDNRNVLLAGNWGQLTADSPLRKYLAHDQDFCIDNAETAEIYRNAKVGINFYRQEWDDVTPVGPVWAMGPREVEMAACAMPFLRDPRGEGDQVLSMLPTYSGPADAAEKLSWMLDHEREREKMATRAREAIADRTFDANAKRLLRLLDDA